MKTGWLGLAMLVGGCASVVQGRSDVAVPDRAQFEQVADAISQSCATLDCHGQIGRNFRMYWGRGLRLLPTDRPGEGATTTEEYDETYKSLVALEPYKLDAVVKGTTSPESLTLVRKGRGVEHHKGNAMLVPGSDADRCLVTWLANAIDTEACTRAKAP